MADAGIGEVAMISSLASVGLQAGAGAEKASAAGMQGQAAIMRAAGEQSADEMRAAQAEQAAQFGRLQAEMTDTTMRERLSTTLGNIDAIRAAGHADPTSPTTAAIEDFQSQVSDRQRLAADVTQRTQAASDEASAAYLRSAGNFALAQGQLGAGIAGKQGTIAELSAGASIFGSLAKGFGPNGSFSLGTG